MSLPSTKPAQSSIRSFFASSAPKYAPPPGTNSNGAKPTSSAAQTPPAPPPPVSQPADKNNSSVSSSSSPTTSSQLPLPPPPPSLPDEASVALITDENVSPLRRINALLLPVPYQDDFYDRAVDPAANGRYSRVITYSHPNEPPKVVGGIVCRLVDANAAPAKKDLYISSLCLLAPYRKLGLVAAALDNIVATAVLDVRENLGAVTAHVWTGHEDSLAWYERRGFARQSPPVEGYYLRLRPASAWIVRREVTTNVRDALPASPGSGPPAPPAGAARGAVPPSATAAVVNLPRPAASRGQSYMDQRAETEWNDLPAEMAPPKLPRKGAADSEGTSAASSRSSSAARKKRDRSYPAAAFGNGS